MQFSAVKINSAVFYEAKVNRNLDAAREIELRVFSLAAELAIEREWRLTKRERGRELLRHAGRLALARHLDHRLWDRCKSCEHMTTKQSADCVVCGGTRCWFMPLEDFVLEVGDRYSKVWMGWVNQISNEIKTWYQEIS